MVLALVDLITAAAWNLLNPLGYDMHLDHGALQHMCGAGLDCIPSTLLLLLLLLLLLRADCTSRAREEEEDRRHGAVVTGIAVVRRFGIWKSHGPVVSSCGVIVMLHRPKHVHNISTISDDGTCACRPHHDGGLEPVESTGP